MSRCCSVHAPELLIRPPTKLRFGWESGRRGTPIPTQNRGAGGVGQGRMTRRSTASMARWGMTRDIATLTLASMPTW